MVKLEDLLERSRVQCEPFPLHLFLSRVRASDFKPPRGVSPVQTTAKDTERKVVFADHRVLDVVDVQCSSSPWLRD